MLWGEWVPSGCNTDPLTFTPLHLSGFSLVSCSFWKSSLVLPKLQGLFWRSDTAVLYIIIACLVSTTPTTTNWNIIPMKITLHAFIHLINILKFTSHSVSERGSMDITLAKDDTMLSLGELTLWKFYHVRSVILSQTLIIRAPCIFVEWMNHTAREGVWD